MRFHLIFPTTRSVLQKHRQLPRGLKTVSFHLAWDTKSLTSVITGANLLSVQRSCATTLAPRGSSFASTSSSAGRWPDYLEPEQRFCNLSVLRGKLSNEIWWLILNAHKKSMGLFLLLSARHLIMGKGYNVMESFADHMPCSVLLMYFTALGRWEMVSHVSFHDL